MVIMLFVLVSLRFKSPNCICSRDSSCRNSFVDIVVVSADVVVE